jgi:hypothetical protein
MVGLLAKFEKIITTQVFSSLPKDTYNINFTAKECVMLCLEEQIVLLSTCIEHPNKPGYKRSDVENKIKELMKKINEIKLDI